MVDEKVGKNECGQFIQGFGHEGMAERKYFSVSLPFSFCVSLEVGAKSLSSGEVGMCKKFNRGLTWWHSG